MGGFILTLFPTIFLWIDFNIVEKYRALAKCTCEAISLCRLQKELGFSTSSPVTLWCDNQSSLKISKNPVFHDKTKHFEVDWHFSRQKIEDGTLQVSFINTNNQPADIFC